MNKLTIAIITSLISVQANASTQTAPLVASTPELILPQGVDINTSVNPYTGEAGEVRKGTIAATITNVAILNKLLEADPNVTNIKNITEVTNTVRTLLSPLKVTGMFDLFTPLEWISNLTQPGRILTGILYFQTYPEKVTPEIKTQLEFIKVNASNNLIKQEATKLLESKI